MQFGKFGYVVVASGLLAASLCGCQGDSSAVRKDADTAPVSSSSTLMPENSNSSSDAGNTSSTDVSNLGKQYDEMMSQSKDIYTSLLSSVYDGEDPVSYDEFLERIGYSRGDKKAMFDISEAMGMGLLMQDSSSEPNFRAYGLGSVVHRVFSDVESSATSSSFDWSVQAQLIYDDLRICHSSRSDVDSQLILFQNLASEANLDESSYKPVIARDDVIVELGTAEFERLCEEHGVQLNKS